MAIAPRPAAPTQQSLIHAVEAAVGAFNRGDVEALIPRSGGPRRRRRSCPDASSAAIGERPVSISHISCVDAGRVLCSLVTAHGTEVVGVYCLSDGRISDADHFFSDVELLVSVGILQPGATAPRFR